jgi:RNA polymerase sigma factor (TIGR02999 family)
MERMKISGAEREAQISNPSVTAALEALDRGESLASERLLPLVYDELRRLAAQKMAREAPEHTLQPTALVHEAYLRLIGPGGARWENRDHFYAAAAEAMRRILIEAARRKASVKHGGNHVRVEFTAELAPASASSSDSLLALNEALEKLEAEDPESYRLVMLRYFAGLNVDEAAEAMGVSPRTAKRHWSFARAWLQREIERESHDLLRPCPPVKAAAFAQGGWP